MSDQNYRLYSFVNFYLSSIQQGVQTAHLVHTLFTEVAAAEPRNVLDTWAKEDKTIIILNGGANQDIQEKFIFLAREAGAFSWKAPYGAFSEDDRSLGGVMTCCGLVVPERIYNAQYSVQFDEYIYDVPNQPVYRYGPMTSDYRFLQILKSCGLAK